MSPTCRGVWPNQLGAEILEGGSKKSSSKPVVTTLVYTKERLNAENIICVHKSYDGLRNVNKRSFGSWGGVSKDLRKALFQNTETELGKPRLLSSGVERRKAGEDRKILRHVDC